MRQCLSQWCRLAAPWPALRWWHSQDPERFADLTRRYHDELVGPEHADSLGRARAGPSHWRVRAGQPGRDRGERCRALGAAGNGPDRQHRALRLIVTLQSAVVLLAGYTPWHSLLGIAWTAATAALMFTLAAAKPAPAGRGQLSAGHRGARHARRRAAGHRRAARPRAEHGRRCAVGRPARRPGHRLLRPARSPPTASRWTSGWSAMSSTSARPSAPRATDATAGTCPVSSDVEGLYADWPAHPHRPALNRPVRVRDRGRRAGRAVCQTVGLSPSRQVRWESGAVALLTSTRSTSCGSRARKPAAQAHHPLFLRARGELAC